MKKIIITIMAIIMMMSLASCKEHSTSKTWMGGNEIHMSETVMEDGEVIEEHHWVVVYDTVEEAWNAMHD